MAENAATAAHVQKPGGFTRRVLNPAIAWFTRRGFSVWGSRVLETKGRKSGQPRHTPVNLLELDGHHYLVSPRGHGDWVKNVRADNGSLVLILGKKRTEHVATEQDPTAPETITVLRAYLKKWKFEVGAFFEGVGPDSTDAELAAVAPRHPIFELS